MTDLSGHQAPLQRSTKKWNGVLTFSFLSFLSKDTLRIFFLQPSKLRCPWGIINHCTKCGTGLLLFFVFVVVVVVVVVAAAALVV